MTETEGNGRQRQARLAVVRSELAQRGLNGFVVPRADEHQGESVPARAERLAWLSGFGGSAGLAVVLAERAVVFVDGRYTLQVRAEVDDSAWEFRHLIDDPLSAWLTEALPNGGRLGFDPWLHTVNWLEKNRAGLERARITLIPEATNPIDAVWPDQPPPPLAPVVAHPLEYAGRSAAEKRALVAESLRRDRVQAAVLTQPDSIAWLLNIRGGDVPRTPLPLGFAVIGDDGRVALFMDARKLTPGLETHLGPEVTLTPPAALGEALDRLGDGRCRVRLDVATAAAALFMRLEQAGAVIDRGADPCVLPKACKNAVELAGARAAHSRDGAAMVRFLHWLTEAVPGGTVTERSAAERLLAFRHQNPLFCDLSFDTISATGANGAIVHYRVSKTSDRRLEPGTLYLVDSGAQYPDGTTDVTRTIALGSPSAEMRERFTRVLQGHIALATVLFPDGTTGSQLDALARFPLWQIGLDYDHGTGHGVGSYLGVHEGPQRISKAHNGVALQPGMILSNEPGCYVAGAYGIRIENLQVVTEATTGHSEQTTNRRPPLGFEILTLVPIDRTLIEPSLLSPHERNWLDCYHRRVRTVLTPHLDPPVAAGLEAATRPRED